MDILIMKIIITVLVIAVISLSGRVYYLSKFVFDNKPFEDLMECLNLTRDYAESSLHYVERNFVKVPNAQSLNEREEVK